MIQIISVPRRKIRYQNSWMRRYSVLFVEVIFVQAIPFPVCASRLRQNKSLVEIFINEGTSA